MKRTINMALFVTMMLSACMKEELPVPVHPRGDAREVQVCMGPGYQDQLWVDLASGEIVSSNTKTAWALAFESSTNGWRVMLNGSLLMTAWNVGDVDITIAADTSGIGAGRRIDAPSGHPDSTAIGDWRANSSVYIVDLGYDWIGQHLGFRKLSLQGSNAASYQFQVARLDGTDLQQVSLSKDPLCTYTYYSFSSGVVTISPPRGAWDLVFTQYTHQFQEPFLPYIVTGALIDEGTTRVARISSVDFNEVALSDTLGHPLSNKRNTIGYDWKEFSFDTGSYLVDPNVVYIVQDAEGFFFKLHFLEFYGPQGQPGCPLFAVVAL